MHTKKANNSPENVNRPVEPVVVMRKGDSGGTEGEELDSWAQWPILAAVCAGTEVAQEGDLQWVTVFCHYPSCGTTAHLGLQ